MPMPIPFVIDSGCQFRICGASAHEARTAKEEEAQKQAQLAADKEQERKRKHKEVEEEAEAEEDCAASATHFQGWLIGFGEELVEEEKRRIKAARKAGIGHMKYLPQ